MSQLLLLYLSRATKSTSWLTTTYFMRVQYVLKLTQLMYRLVVDDMHADASIYLLCAYRQWILHIAVVDNRPKDSQFVVKYIHVIKFPLFQYNKISATDYCDRYGWDMLFTWGILKV